MKKVVHGTLKKVLRYLSIFRSIVFVSYKESIAFRSVTIFSLFAGPILFLVQYSIWTALYANQTSINGLTLNQMLTYFSYTLIINYLIWDQADMNLQHLIMSGKFSVFLLKPVDYFYYAFCMKVGHLANSLFLESIPVFCILFFIFKIDLMPVYPLWTLLSLVLSFFMMLLLNLVTGILGFWITKIQSLGRFLKLLRDLLSGVFIPLNFFPHGIQLVFLFLPFQYITYVPIRVILGSYELGSYTISIPQIVLYQLIYTVLMFIVARLLWRVSIVKFSGVGI